MSVVARHIGRLGNNMFQIAAAIGYAKKYGYRWAADPMKGLGEPYSSIWDVFPNMPMADYFNGQRYHEHPNDRCQIHGTHYDHCHFDYHPIPDMGPNLILTGFFQSWKYFENAQDEVKEVFKLRDYPEMRDYVSIHVRRGDYVQHSGSFPPISVAYIDQAIYFIEEMALRENPIPLMFFSDDIAWCREFFGRYNKVEFSEGRNDFEDMSLMSSCSHHIIANSTFSWWAAYLGKNPDRIVVSPSHKRLNWFGPSSGVQKDCVDLIPPHWHEIQFR